MESKVTYKDEWRGITPDTLVALQWSNSHQTWIKKGLNTVPESVMLDCDAHFYVTKASHVWSTGTANLTNIWTVELPPDAQAFDQNNTDSYNKIVAHKQLPIVASILSIGAQSGVESDMEIPVSDDLVQACLVFSYADAVFFGSQTLLNDVDFAKEYVYRFEGASISAFSDTVLANKDFAKACLEMNPLHFDMLDESLRDDPEIAALIFDEECVWHNISARLLNNLDFVLQGIRQGGPRFFAYAGNDLKQNRDAIKAALQVDGNVLRYVDFAMQDTALIHLAMVRTPEAFMYASPELKQHPDEIMQLLDQLQDHCSDQHKHVIIRYSHADTVEELLGFPVFNSTFMYLIQQGLRTASSTSTKRKRYDE